MLKKIGIYCVILLSGILLGYIFFMPDTTTLPGPSSESMETVVKWTCSMHPEIDGKENGTCPLCNMDLVYMDTQSSNEISVSQFKMTKEAVALANIETSIVSLANIENSTILVSGKIKTNSETDRLQTTLLDGRIDNFYINSIGKRVRKGQQIGVMYSPELYLAQDKLLSSVSYKEKNMKLYLAARNTLGLWKMTDEQIDELIRSKTPLNNFPLYSDVSGTVTEVFALQGQYFKQGDVLFKTSDLRTVWAEFDVYESQLNSLQIGQEVLITSATFNSNGIKAAVNFIEPVINELKRTATVRVVIPNKKNLLKPGMIVSGEISQFKTDNTMISVPKSAVLWTGKRSLVYKQVSESEPVFEPTEVLLGKRLSDHYEVLNGLSVGDIIVSEGAFTVDAAAQLNGSKSMMSSNSVMLEVNNIKAQD